MRCDISSSRDLYWKPRLGAQQGLWDNAARALRCQNRWHFELSAAGQVLWDERQEADSASGATRAEWSCLSPWLVVKAAIETSKYTVAPVSLSEVGEHANKRMWLDWTMFKYSFNKQILIGRVLGYHFCQEMMSFLLLLFLGFFGYSYERRHFPLWECVNFTAQIWRNSELFWVLSELSFSQNFSMQSEMSEKS